MVVQNLESQTLQGQSMARPEFNYTKKMIGANLSNFSAWHNRTQLITTILAEEQATDEERQQMLDEGDDEEPLSESTANMNRVGIDSQSTLRPI